MNTKRSDLCIYQIAEETLQELFSAIEQHHSSDNIVSIQISFDDECCSMWIAVLVVGTESN